jgi:hypothetical protein
VNGTDNLSIPESCGGQSQSIPKTGLQNLYSVPLQIEGTVLKSSDGRLIFGVDFDRTVNVDVVDGAVGGMTITITGRLLPVP